MPAQAQGNETHGGEADATGEIRQPQPEALARNRGEDAPTFMDSN